MNMDEQSAIGILNDLYDTHRHMFYQSLKGNLIYGNSDKLNLRLFHTFKYFFNEDKNKNDSKTLVSIVEKTKLIQLFHFFYPYWVAFVLMNSEQADLPLNKSVTEYYVRFFDEYQMPVSANIR